MVIGKSYKENSILILVLYIFLFLVFVSGIACSSIFIDKLVFKIVLIVLVSVLLLLSSYLPYYVYKCRKIPENVIVYNRLDETKLFKNSTILKSGKNERIIFKTPKII